MKIDKVAKYPSLKNIPVMITGGGSGIGVIRYQIGRTNTAKCSGGAISFYNGKTIHAFTNSGTLVTSGEAIPSAEVFMVAGDTIEIELQGVGTLTNGLA